MDCQNSTALVQMGMVTEVQFWIAFMFQQYFRLAYCASCLRNGICCCWCIGLRNPLEEDDVRAMPICTSAVEFWTSAVQEVTNFKTRKPYYHKETGRCCSCSFWLKVSRQHSLQV